MLGQVLERVRQLQPSRIFSSHLPTASGTSMEDFVRILEMVPDSEPFRPPSAEELGHLIEALTAAQQAGGVPGQRSEEPAGSALPS